MKNKIFFWSIACWGIAIFAKAQEPKFSVQFNTGYTWFSGKKIKVAQSPDNLAFGSFINGQIPLEAELRYKVANKFTLNFAYGYGIGLPYKATGKRADGLNDFYRTANLSTHTLRIGEVFYFRDGKIRPYMGLDLALLLSQLVEKSVAAKEVVKTSNIFATFGLLPKFGIEYNLNEKLFLNFAVHYTLVVQTEINRKGQTDAWYTRDQQAPSHGVGINIGVGYRF